MKPLIFPIFLLLLACNQSGRMPASPRTATLVLLNGQLFTADSLKPSATALAIRGDRILAVGSDADMKALAGDSAQLIDLAGAFAMPGFIEGHGHFAALGRSLENINLMGLPSWNSCIDQVRDYAAEAQPGAWVEGRGWHQEKWTEMPGPSAGGYPTHERLSAAVPDKPVVLKHASGHALMANARAMELAGVTARTKDPAGGRIVRDARGNPSGVFEENAMLLLETPLEAWKNARTEGEKRAEFDRISAAAAAHCLSRGITSFQDAGSTFWELDQYRRLASNGQLNVRLWAMALQPSPADSAKLAAYPVKDEAGFHFTCQAVKAYLDGALGSYGAWMLEPYADKPGHYGQNVFALDSLNMLAERCRQRGLQLCVHAIGDRANREVLNLYERVFNTWPSGKKARWRIEHAQHVDPADQPRFARLGVIASMQALHCTSDAPFVQKRLGEQRARTGAYAWRNLLDAGANLANGTDTPVEPADPLPCLYASVTRQPAQGPAFFPEQCMTREEALKSYSLWNAYAAFEENDKGSLSPGKLADIVVLSANLLNCTPEEIPKARVLWTILGGKVAYQQK